MRQEWSRMETIGLINQWRIGNKRKKKKAEVEFHLREQGIWNECGKIAKQVW